MVLMQLPFFIMLPLQISLNFINEAGHEDHEEEGHEEEEEHHEEVVVEEHSGYLASD